LSTGAPSPDNAAEEAEVAAWFAARSETPVIETACARVYLAGGTAFKVKRRVDLGYLDFTTLDQRRWALERELAFNQATAADIYRGVSRVTRAADGQLAIEGFGVTVDYALEMRRFDEHLVLSACPERVDADLADALGRRIARFHAEAPVRPEGGGAANLKYTIDSNAHLLRGMADRLGPAEVEGVIAATEAEFERFAPLLEARRAAGFSRHCHGDLHLGNIVLEAGQPVLFDCIEFNDALSEIDVLYDIAFLLMDLDFRGKRGAAAHILAAYFDQAARVWGEELRAGMALLPLLLSVRAVVRAHVCGNSGKDAEARAYLAAAAAHLRPEPPVLAAVGGLSGSGKTSFARAIAGTLGASPGALVLRTDEIRKRLLKVAPTASLPASVYSPGFYAEVYDTVLADARALLAAGRAVVLDATFIQPDLRQRVEALAAEAGVPFHAVWLEAPVEVLASRIAHRTGDASDATVATLKMQLERDVGEIAWTRIDATRPVAETAGAWLAAIRKADTAA
jgi:aminoglycoside phosphotransferase family enzyme/predicted kinase